MSGPTHRRAPNVSKSRLIYEILDYLSDHDECLMSVIAETKSLTRRRVKETLEESVQYGLVTCRIRQRSHKAMLYSITDLGHVYLLALKVQAMIAPFDDISQEDWIPGNINALIGSMDEMGIFMERLNTMPRSPRNSDSEEINSKAYRGRHYDRMIAMMPADRNDLPTGRCFI